MLAASAKPELSVRFVHFFLKLRYLQPNSCGYSVVAVAESADAVSRLGTVTLLGGLDPHLGIHPGATAVGCVLGGCCVPGSLIPRNDYGSRRRCSDL